MIRFLYPAGELAGPCTCWLSLTQPVEEGLHDLLQSWFEIEILQGTRTVAADGVITYQLVLEPIKVQALKQAMFVAKIECEQYGLN